MTNRPLLAVFCQGIRGPALVRQGSVPVWLLGGGGGGGGSGVEGWAGRRWHAGRAVMTANLLHFQSLHLVVCPPANPVSNFFPELSHSVQEEKFGNGLGGGLWVSSRSASLEQHPSVVWWPSASRQTLRRNAHEFTMAMVLFLLGDGNEIPWRWQRNTLEMATQRLRIKYGEGRKRG